LHELAQTPVAPSNSDKANNDTAIDNADKTSKDSKHANIDFAGTANDLFKVLNQVLQDTSSTIVAQNNADAGATTIAADNSAAQANGAVLAQVLNHGRLFEAPSNTGIVPPPAGEDVDNPSNKLKMVPGISSYEDIFSLE